MGHKVGMIPKYCSINNISDCSWLRGVVQRLNVPLQPSEVQLELTVRLATRTPRRE